MESAVAELRRMATLETLWTDGQWRDAVGALLAALSAQQPPPTPEEAARDVASVMAAVEEAPFDDARPAYKTDAEDALSRLAAQAARVPGLEEQAQADRYAIHGALMWSGAWPLGVEKLKPTRHVSALLERLTQAESERDAVREELKREKSLRKTWADNVRQVELVLGFDRPDGMTLKDAKDHMAGVSTLRERVATLEQRTFAAEGEVLEARKERDAAVRRGDEAAAHWNSLADGWQETAGKELARADTAEARVRELLDLLRKHARRVRCPDCEGIGSRTCSTCEGDKECLPPEVTAALASHPAPTTGAKCSHCGGKGYDVDTDEEGGTQNETHFPCSRCKGKGLEPSPTPPPGLLEAVLAAVNAERSGWDIGGDRSEAVHTACTNLENRIRVAFDAAKGGEVPSIIVEGAQRPNDDRAPTYIRAEFRECPACAAKPGSPALCPECLERRELFACREGAAKYRAAVERARDVATLAKVSFEAWREHRRPPSKLTEDQAQASAVARHVLGLDSSTPSETLDKARVVEVLRKWLPPTHAVFEDLGLDTPPTRPGVGEPPSRDDVLNAFAVEADPAGALERYQREHPALAEDLAALFREVLQPLVEQEGPLAAEDEALIDKVWTQHAAIKPKPTVDLWPTLTAFSAEMRRLLDHHRPRKGGREGWVRDMPAALLRRVQEEADEVELGLAARVSPEVLLARCADVANMAMMTADAYAHQRARMTPVPAVPLIEGPVDEPPATPDLHAEHCTPDECKYGEGRACTMWHDPALEGKPPQRVVWEDKDVRVLANGTLLIFGPHGWGQPLTKTMRLQRLARALAKAKFDARLARASLASSEEALRQKDKAVAEDTRERVARMVENVGLKNLASVIRAAPLRGKAVRRG
ncbi:hypothetical protein MVI01_72450 [Myxococcus virescens]|uniref:Uncharacterized protein n=2 Tax=Myxococcus virescens TaxID=83456 RepID=A0A511HPE3_9BACT|nr:hypothetical protein MVI01_72450 [Myxococcus virescens]